MTVKIRAAKETDLIVAPSFKKYTGRTYDENFLIQEQERELIYDRMETVVPSILTTSDDGVPQCRNADIHKLTTDEQGSIQHTSVAANNPQNAVKKYANAKTKSCNDRVNR